MSDDVLAAADRILAKWKAAYDDLVIPMFDSGYVFGDAIDSDDVQALDEAVARAKGEATRWTYEEES